MAGMRTVALIAFCLGLSFTAIAMDVGKPAPAFTVQRLNGPAIPLSQFKGKVVALAFIDTECPHCQHLTGLLNEIAKQYQAKGVQFVECAFNDAAMQRLPWFIQQFQPTATMGYSQRDPVLNFLSYSILKPLYVPHMVFIDRKGVVQGDYAGESEFMSNPEKNIPAKLDELLKPAVTTSAHPAPHKARGGAVKSTASAAPSHP
jgi:thiol-disulfide isomerase/thioredoxin